MQNGEVDLRVHLGLKVLASKYNLSIANLPPQLQCQALYYHHGWLFLLKGLSEVQQQHCHKVGRQLHPKILTHPLDKTEHALLW